MTTVVLIHRVYVDGLTDVYGDPAVPMESAETVPEALVAPTSTTDLSDATRHGESERLDVYLPTSYTVTPEDGFRIDGNLYEIDGVPSSWVGMTGWGAGQVVHVWRTLG